MKTYKLVPTEDAPIMGEMRFTVSWLPDAITLGNVIDRGSMWPLFHPIVWTGTAWYRADGKEMKNE